MIESIELPHPTDATVEGPRVRAERSTLVIEYDHAAANGGFDWVRLHFSEVLAFSHRQAVCCEAEDVIGSRVLQRIASSAWLDSLLAGWDHGVGWHEWEQQRGGRRRFSHYRVYFDDVGCFDVVAGDCRVE